MRIWIYAVTAAAGATLATATASLAQTPTAAQQQAIRSNCVSDFRENCSGVQPHGMDALICLEQHEDKLSSGCKSAVEAVGQSSGGSAASATATPAATESSSAASTERSTAAAAESSAAATATEAARSGGEAASAATAASRAATTPASGMHTMSFRDEIRIAARSCARDYRVLCPGTPVGQGNVLFCLKVHANRLSTPCRNALLEAGERF